MNRRWQRRARVLDALELGQYLGLGVEGASRGCHDTFHSPGKDLGMHMKQGGSQAQLGRILR